MAYFECMLACFNDSTIYHISSLIPIITKEFEKSITQPTQIPVVMEGLAAACLLLKIASSQVEKENSFNNLWSTVCDMDKQLFVSEKFISSASDNGKY